MEDAFVRLVMAKAAEEGRKTNSEGVVVTMSHCCLQNVKIDVFMSCCFNKCPLAIWETVESSLFFLLFIFCGAVGLHCSRWWEKPELCLGSSFVESTSYVWLCIKVWCTAEGQYRTPYTHEATLSSPFSHLLKAACYTHTACLNFQCYGFLRGIWNSALLICHCQLKIDRLKVPLF